MIAVTDTRFVGTERNVRAGGRDGGAGTCSGASPCGRADRSTLSGIGALVQSTALPAVNQVRAHAVTSSGPTRFKPCSGQPMSPDPYHAVANAIEHYRIDDILISTLAGEKSKWLEEGLIERVQALTDKPVEHIESGTEPAEESQGQPSDAGAEPTAAVGAREAS